MKNERKAARVEWGGEPIELIIARDLFTHHVHVLSLSLFLLCEYWNQFSKQIFTFMFCLWGGKHAMCISSSTSVIDKSADWMWSAKFVICSLIRGFSRFTFLCENLITQNFPENVMFFMWFCSKRNSSNNDLVDMFVI